MAKQKKQTGQTKKNWIEAIVRKRNSMASAVSICQTTDEERIKEFTTFVMSYDVVIEPERKEQVVYEADYHTGVSRLYKDGASIRREKVPLDITFDPTEPMLRFLEAEAQTKRIVAIIKGFIRPNPMLEDFINAVSYSDQWFGTDSSAVIFVPDQTQIVGVVRQRTAIVDIPLSTEDERMKMVLANSERYHIPVSDVQSSQIVQTLSGMNLTNVDTAMLETILTKRDFDIPYLARLKSEAIQRETPLQVLMNGSHGFQAIGGYASLKELLQRQVVAFLRNKEKADRMGITPPRGIMLCGMGGTGKTVFGKALANELGIPFIMLTPADFLTSGIVSESEANMRRTLKTIDEIGRCVIFIDEIDSIATQRGQSGEMDGGTARRVFGLLLAWLSEKQDSIIVATTNRPQDIDKDFRRRGRFDVIVPMLLPDTEARREILRVHCEVVRHAPTHLSEEEWMGIAEATQYWNGAELEALVVEAMRNAFHGEHDEAEAEHFWDALENFKVDLDERRKRQEEFLNLTLYTHKSFVDEARRSFQQTTMSRADRVKAKMQGE